MELWNRIPESQRATGQSTLGISVDASQGNGKLAIGRLISTACSEDKGTLIVIEGPTNKLSFHGKNFRVGFSDTLWYGDDHFSVCHHLEAMRAVIRYAPSTDPSYAGEIVELGVRDDLPQPIDPKPAPSSLTSAR